MTRSAGESPITAVRASAHAERPAEQVDGIRVRLDRVAVVGTRDGLHDVRDAEVASVRSVGLAVVRGRHGDPDPGRAEAGEERREVRDRSGQDDAGPGHARRRRRSAGHRRPGRQPRRSRRGAPPGGGPSGVAARPPWGSTRPVARSTPMTSARRSSRRRPPWAAASRSPSSRTQPLHMRWNSISVPSLSKIASSMPARSGDRARRARGGSPRWARGSRLRDELRPGR